MSTIYWSPVNSIMNNKPSGTVVIGQPGSGKTFFLLNVAANSLLTGCRVIYLDPKNDAKSLANIIPDISITDVNNISPGALNPFKVFHDVSTNSILSVISCICGKLSDKQMVAVSPIVNDFVIKNNKNKEHTTFSMLSDYLYASDNEFAQTIGTTLKINEDSKYGKLIFSDSDSSFKLDRESHIISLLGMPLPSSLTLEMTQDEKFSSAIVYIICKMLREILTEDSKIPVILIIDEAHVLFSNPAMSNIIWDFLSMGRSLNVCTVLASQNMSKFPDGIEQLIASKFMFGSSPKEAVEFLNRFDSSSSGDKFDRPSIVDYIGNVDTGVCFFIDNKNRGGFIKIKSYLDVTSNPLFKDR